MKKNILLPLEKALCNLFVSTKKMIIIIVLYCEYKSSHFLAGWKTTEDFRDRTRSARSVIHLIDVSEKFTAQLCCWHPQRSGWIPSLFHPHRVFIFLICCLSTSIATWKQSEHKKFIFWLYSAVNIHIEIFLLCGVIV